ncbi:AraC family transcriptional regulator [Elongatibacter sediminis]|uniref:AraC family transcriptional regulator n=1 Tax=Elongatibacter sediminis TaxID=3119006 RepID=A0AAW9R643_9GAMM
MNMELASSTAHLAGFNPYTTDDLDAAREHIGGLFVPHHLDVVGCNQVLDVVISQAELEGVSLIYHRHGACVSVQPRLFEDFFLLQIPLRGEAYVTVDEKPIYCHPRQAVMISPTLGVDMKFGQGCEQLIVRVERSDLERQMEQHLGRHLGLPVEFAPAVPLTTAPAREVTNLLRYMAMSLTQSGGMLESSIAKKHMSSLLISALINCLDHNYQEELISGKAAPRPAYISKAQEFMRRNFAEAIGPADIAEAADVSTRALFAGFRTCLNTTPMRYLKEMRLDMVHDALRRMEPRRTSVTTVAMNYGFSHLGHFCAAYKQKFGELPRDTLRQSSSGKVLN